jgi:hypothetical protein
VRPLNIKLAGSCPVVSRADLTVACMHSFLSFGIRLQIRAPTMHRDLAGGLLFVGLSQFVAAGLGLVRSLSGPFAAFCSFV